MNTTLFQNDKFGEIRNVMEGATPWFVANDVAKALGYKATNDLTKRLDPDEVDTTNRRMTLINESGLYHACFLSRLEGAKEFRKWVTSEVLPSIRKNGFYVSDNITPNQLARLQYTVKNQQKKLHQLEAQNEILDRQNDKLIEALARKTSTYRTWYYGK